MRIKSRKQREFSLASRITIQTILLVWAIGQIYPLIWTLGNAFKPEADIISKPLNLPTRFYLGNFDFEYFNSISLHFGIYAKNSVIITVLTIIIVLSVCYLAGYVIAKFEFKGKNFLLLFLLSLIGMPIQAVIIPLYNMVAKFGLLSNWFGVILPYVGFRAPFTVLMLQSYFRDFPNELIEAGRIDGCNEFKVFIRIVFPISMSALTTIFIITFVTVWNEFLFAFVMLKSNDAKTLAVGVYSFAGEFLIKYGYSYAILSLVILPAILVYSIFQRNIMKGAAAGAIKG